MKNWYYAISLLLALGLSVAACGDRERREEPLSRAPSESVTPAPEPRAGEVPASPYATEQEKKDAAREPGEQKSSS
jgi:predicted small lipoprotein YifL